MDFLYFLEDFMKANYNKLLKLLIDKHMTKTELREKAKISSSTLAKIGKEEMLSPDVLMKICEVLNCDISDILELVKDENEEYIVVNSPNKLKVVSLFSGAGGMDLGFINSGFEIIWANDFFQEAVDSYRKNIGKHMIYGDITKISSDDIPDGADVIIGGFPCQGFSVANTRRSMEDKRNFLYREMLRIIKDKNPKFFVAEKSGELLGYVGISCILDEGYITNIAVYPKHRKKGVATALIKRVFDLADEIELSFVSLEVRESNFGAISLYEKMGFKKEGLRKNFYRDPQENACIMTKRFEENEDISN
jgi:ribosomal-protein-alanine acetyltransferase